MSEYIYYGIIAYQVYKYTNLLNNVVFVGKLTFYTTATVFKACSYTMRMFAEKHPYISQVMTPLHIFQSPS